LTADSNVFVERLWRSIKYEEIYLHAYETVAAAKQGLARYLDFYNDVSCYPTSLCA
jgi:putative transposase